MYWKENRFYKADPMSNAATWKEELPESGLLAAIRLQFEQVNANGVHNNNKARLIDHLTKLEVTNGADKTMFSLRGQELKALNFYDMGVVPYEKAILYGNKTQRTDVIIPFGRYWKDKEYMLDLAAWDSVYLELTNDLLTADCADKKAKVDVSLLTAEDLTTIPSKYIKNYEWRSEKPKADTQYVYHDLPTTESIRRLMVQIDPDLETVGDPVSDPKTDSFELKYSYLQEKETVLEHRPRDIMRMNAFDYGIVETRGRYYPSTTQYWDTAIADVITNVASPFKEAAGDGTDYVHLTESNERFQVAGSMGDMTILELFAKGTGYYHTMVLEDHKLEPEREWLNPTKGAGGKGPVRIAWYGHTDDHTFRTCLNVAIAQGDF